MADSYDTVGAEDFSDATPGGSDNYDLEFTLPFVRAEIEHNGTTDSIFVWAGDKRIAAEVNTTGSITEAGTTLVVADEVFNDLHVGLAITVVDAGDGEDLETTIDSVTSATEVELVDAALTTVEDSDVHVDSYTFAPTSSDDGVVEVLPGESVQVTLGTQVTLVVATDDNDFQFETADPDETVDAGVDERQISGAVLTLVCDGTEDFTVRGC